MPTGLGTSKQNLPVTKTKQVEKSLSCSSDEVSPISICISKSFRLNKEGTDFKTDSADEGSSTGEDQQVNYANEGKQRQKRRVFIRRDPNRGSLTDQMDEQVSVNVNKPGIKNVCLSFFRFRFLFSRHSRIIAILHSLI